LQEDICNGVERFFKFFGIFAQLLLQESTSFDFLVHIAGFFNIICIKLWKTKEYHTIIPFEISLDTIAVTFEIELSVWMRSGDHLWEINHSNLLFIIDHQIEFIEITMD